MSVAAAAWTLEFDADGLAWLTCDVPGTSTNVLTAAVLQELGAQLAKIRERSPKGLVVRSGKTNGFIAGADVKEFQSIKTPEQGYELVRQGQANTATIHLMTSPGRIDELALAIVRQRLIDQDNFISGLEQEERVA